MKIGNREFDLKRGAYIMGILNVTPDSFSDGGKWNSREMALSHARQMAEEGADLIDVGGESTRPGHSPVSAEEELERVVPVIRLLKQELDIPVSVDTFKAEVAEAALEAGADMVNDIWGLKADPDMAAVIAAGNVPCCLMHNRKEAVYQSYLQEVKTDLEESLETARKAGIKEDRIILDPGIGFGKTLEQNLCLMNHLEELCALGFPVLLGTSRKSMIGLTLDLPVTEREEGTLATTVMGLMKGCRIFRVHDVKKNRRAMLMAKAIMEETAYGQH
ncbi:dihydropteroate synthase [Cuneatibacter caecimuris]|uniref:Dihydropteroate synthase n=1 Tax=Cuneatibacter caecimuris TaxID=1796618 RepID=A0A4Q7PTQ6_9FIRM|nr:dihydropteroate synthase [Cuneatibacter caecimuris]RZT02700.1 dihydropteroate synthase [Cuneatibacter caecimuris]